MKRLFFILTISIVVFWFISCKQTKVKEPERLSNIPYDAKWVGGADGGNWYEVSKVLSENTFKIKIYNDGNGNLEVDTIFTLNPNCSLQKIDSLKLLRSIDGFDGEKILLNIDKHRCLLTMK